MNRHAHSTLRWLPVALALAFLTGACWQDKEEIGNVVWSDDDSGHAYQLLLFEQQTRVSSPLVGSDRRNFRYQVFVQNADGSGRRALAGERIGQPGGFFFYMKDAGYVLQNVIESPTSQRIDLIRTATGEAVVLRRHDVGEGPVTPCQGIEALPSPDGETIAVVERVPPTGPSCNGGSVIVELVDASSLQTDARFEWTLNGMPGSTWTRDGELIVWSWADAAWRVDPVAGPVTTTQPTCTQPRTSSSNVSDAGVLIQGGTPDDDPVMVMSTSATSCW